MNTMNQLQAIKTNNFDNVWNSAVTKFNLIVEADYTREQPKRKKMVFDDKDMRRMYLEIIDHVDSQIELQYQSVKKLEFYNLLYSSEYVDYRYNFQRIGRHL